MFILGLIRPQETTQLLSYEDFDKLYRVIQKHASLRLELMMQDQRKKRLNLLETQGISGGFSEEYREMVLGSCEKEEEIYQELTE